MQQIQITIEKKAERMEQIRKALGRGELVDADSVVVIPTLILTIPFYHHDIDNKSGLRCVVEQTTYNITEAWFYRAKGAGTNREVMLTEEELNMIKAYYCEKLQNLWSDFCKATDAPLEKLKEVL